MTTALTISDQKPQVGRALNDSNKQKQAFGGLDLLRFAACLSVVLYHFTFRGSTHDHFTNFSVQGFECVTKYGYLGVALFFVISGFVISYSAEGRRPVDFLIARFARIYPGFLLCMSITFIAILYFGEPELRVTGGQWTANLVIVAPALGHPFIDGAYWSIVFEIIFYGWIFFIKLVLDFERYILEIVGIWAGISAFNLFYLNINFFTNLFITKYSGFFMAGMLVYAIFVKKLYLGLPILFIIVLPLTLFQTFDEIVYHRIYYRGTHFSALIGAVICLGAVGVVALAVLFPQAGTRRGFFMLVGGATYPLYLLHQNIGYIMLNRSMGHMRPEYLLITTVLILTVVAAGIWRFAERPAQKLTIIALRYLTQRTFRSGHWTSTPE